MANLQKFFRIIAAVVLPLTAVTCTDAPVAVPGGAETAPLVIAPQFSYAGVQAGTPQADALDQAFDRVNAVRVLVFTVAPRAQLLDVTIDATADSEGIEVAVEIPGAEPGQELVVVILGLEIVDGVVTELFTTGELSITAQSAEDSGTPQTIEAALVYTGPGATATSVEIVGGPLVLSPGASDGLSARVLGDDGSEITGVPLVWTSDNPAVATVDDAGTVSGAADGQGGVTVTTPNGRAASTGVYVVEGALAFVQGGEVKTASAGTEATLMGGSGARGPAWSPDGARLYYGSGGQVHEVGGAALMDGAWPSVSPDGTKLAAEVAGHVALANIDGSGAIAGPDGGTPSWLDGSTLVVDGGSVHQVRADGAERTTLAANLRARMPALGGGLIVYVGGDDLVHAVGGGVVLDLAVSSRPALSPNGRWVVGSNADGLHVGPVDGSGPVLPLGFPGALDPVFQPVGAAQAPPALVLSGFLPGEPIPGQPVEILGSGFDWIIPANTTVEFPTAAGPMPGGIDAVHPDRIVTTAPRDLVAGAVTVRTRTGEASLTVDPPRFGSVAFSAATPWGAPVAGVGVAISQGGTEVASVVTDSDGSAVVDGVLFGDYAVAVTPPTGFVHTGGDAAVTVGPTLAHVGVEVTPLVDRLATLPPELVVEVDQVIDVEIVPLDINGAVIPVVEIPLWAGASSFITWNGRDHNGIVRGLAPTGAGGTTFPVVVNGRRFEVPVLVPGGVIRTGEVLLFGDRASNTSIINDLTALGHSVTSSPGLPADISGFDVILHVAAFDALTAAEQEQLAGHVNAGKGLMVAGERPCCEALNSTSTALLNVLIAGGGIIVGGLGFDLFNHTFNPTAKGGITTTPNTLTTWAASGPAGLRGVSGDNVLVTSSSPSLQVSGAVWDEADMASGRGRIVMLPDVNWYGSAEARIIWENVLVFLFGALGPPPSPALSISSDAAGGAVTGSSLPTPCATEAARTGLVVCAGLGARSTRVDDIVIVPDDNGADVARVVGMLTSASWLRSRDGGGVVWFDTGRCGRCDLEGSRVRAVADRLERAGFDVERTSSRRGTLVEIPADVGSIWLWHPQESFTGTEREALRAFAARGGRIVLVRGEDSAAAESSLVAEGTPRALRRPAG